jgi:hypothetical protein
VLPKTAKEALKVAKTVIVTGAFDCLYGAIIGKLKSIPFFKNLPVLQLAEKDKAKLKEHILKEMDQFIDGLKRARRNLILRRRMNMFSKIGNAFKKVGKGIVKAGTVVGKGVAKAGTVVGKGVAKAGTVVGKGVAKAGTVVGKGVVKAGTVVGKGVVKAGTVVGKGVVKAGEGVGKGVVKAGEGVGKGVVKAGEGVGKGVVQAGKAVGKGVVQAGKAVGKGVVQAGKLVVKGVTTFVALAKLLLGKVGDELKKMLINFACPFLAKKVTQGLDIALKKFGFPKLPECLHGAFLVGCKKGAELALKKQRILRRLSSLKRELEQF